MSRNLSRWATLLLIVGAGLIVAGVGLTESPALPIGSMLIAIGVLSGIAGVAAFVIRRLRMYLAVRRWEFDVAVKRSAVDAAASAMLAQATPGVWMPVTTFSMTSTNRLALLDLFDQLQPQSVVEFGSGISTLMAANWMKARGHGRVVSFDHDVVWAELCRRHLKRLGLDAWAEVRVAPLKDTEALGHRVKWYDLSREAFSGFQPIDLVIIDGPPGDAQGALNRLPAIPMLVEQLAPDACIFLDDGDRPGERRIVRVWEEQFNLTGRFVHTMTGYWVLNRKS